MAGDRLRPVTISAFNIKPLQASVKIIVLFSIPGI